MFPAQTPNHGEAKLVHGIHEDTVLVVHGSDAYGASVVPG
jgi:hypothetical protein